MKTRLLTGLAVCISTVVSAQSGPAWTQTIERALAAHGIDSQAVSDYRGNTQTLHLTIDGKTVAEPVQANFNALDYSSTVYVVMDGIESRMRYMYPVSGNVNSQMRTNGITATSKGGNRLSTRKDGIAYNSYRPETVWHSHSSLYTPDEVFDDPRDLDLLEVALENSISAAVRVKLVDPAYAKSIPQSEKLLLLRARVIDLQRGIEYEKPKDGAPASKETRKIRRRLAYGNINIQLIDDLTGEVVWQDSIDEDSTTSLSSTDPMDDCIKYMTRKLTRTLDELYPYVAPRLSAQGYVTKMAEFKKEKANSIYINLGAANELKKGDTVIIYLQQTIGGNMGKTQIGTATISEVQGSSLSLCKVKKGEKEIYKAIMEGQTLVVETNW